MVKKSYHNIESPWGSTQREQKEALEFSVEEYKEIDRYCKKLYPMVCLFLG